MKWEEFKLSQVLVLMPIIHIAIASIFIFSYCAGFGAHFSAFESPSDIFRISVGDLIGLYITILLGPAVITIVRVTSPTPYAQDIVNAILEPEAKGKAQNVLNRTRLWLFIGLILLTIIGMYSIYFQIEQNKAIIFLGLFAPAVAWTAIGTWWLGNRLKLTNLTLETIGLVIYIGLSAIHSGLNSGQSERHLSYNAKSDRYPYCGKNQIVRRVSDYYLVILPNGQKALADEKCDLKIAIPPPQQFSLL
jgi:hypothetical protein